MIVFSGELSEKSKKEMSKNFRKIMLIVSSLCALVLAIIILVLTLKLNHMFAYCFVFPVLLVVLPFIPVKLESGSDFLPEKIEIDGEDISIHTKGRLQWYGIENIKVIINEVDCYKLYIKMGIITNVFVCQKDLITEGTLEEFEEKFADFLCDKVE